MLYVRRVVGHSMLPGLKPGQLCLFVRTRHPRQGSVVLAVHEGRDFVKRVAGLRESTADLRGDNAADSHDLLNVPLVDIRAHLFWPRR